MNGQPVPSAYEAELGSWIVEQTLSAETMQTLVEGAASRLLGAGIPLFRLFIAVPMVSPDFRAGVATWDRSRGFSGEGIRHDSGPDEFGQSPFKPMLETGVTSRRWRFPAPGGSTGYPILDRLQADGVTDYLAHLVSFDRTGTRALRGAAISFATDAAEGFTDDQVAQLGRLAPLLGLSALRFASSYLLETVLGCYVGRTAGERILRGEMLRGEGHMVHAAILIADLRGFTQATGRGGTGLVARLGDHLAAMVEPVEALGGEVLKFLGDGLLATFPIPDGGRSAACRAALQAAREALVRNAAVNAAYPETVPLKLDVALHCGELFYGNVGAGSRLDFTVIGAAVNECARIERLCDRLDRHLLMSEDFALDCGCDPVPLGRFALRGVTGERAIYGDPEERGA